MAVSDDVKKRFAEYVKIQALGDRFIDRATERKILEDGVMRFDIGLDEGRQIMLGVASDAGYGFESEADERIRDILDGFAKDRRINKREFTDATTFYRKFCNNGVNEEEARKRVKRAMIRDGLRPRGRLLVPFSKRWYSRIDVE